MNGKLFIVLCAAVLSLFVASSFMVIKNLEGNRTVQSRQRNLARALPSLYLKYKIDNGHWPPTAKEAAIHFRSENETFVSQVSDAEMHWGMKTQVVQKDHPSLQVTFSKPIEYDLEFVLEER